jgi:hypothetical protein
MKSVFIQFDDSHCMRKIIIEYACKAFEKKNGRRSSSEMKHYLMCLVDEMRSADIAAEYIESVVTDGISTVTINGIDVMKILDGLEIKMLDEEEDCGCSPNMIKIERPFTDWNRNEIEDIPDVLMKNAISKAYADMNKNT